MFRRSLLLIVLLGLPGCYTYAPVDVYVFDAQTKQPIEGIRIESFYAQYLEIGPKHSQATTDRRGLAHLEICKDYEPVGRPVGLALNNDGYFLDQPQPAGIFILPIERLRAPHEEPYRVDLGLLKVDAYRDRYPR